MSDLDISETLFLLRDQRRRFVIDTIDFVTVENGDYIEVSKLADEVAKREFGDDYTDDQRKTAYVSLKQTHIEALDDADVIEYRDLAGIVQASSNFEAISETLDAVRSTIETADNEENTENVASKNCDA